MNQDEITVFEESLTTCIESVFLAARALGTVPDAHDANSPIDDDRVRFCVAETLRPEPDLDALFALTKDRAPRVRRAAVLALGQCECLDGADLLIDVALTCDHKATAQLAIRELAKFHDDDDVCATLSHFVSHPDGETARVAFAACQHMPKATRIALANALLERGDPSSTVLALGTFANIGVRPDDRFLQHDCPRVKSTAKAAGFFA